MKTLALFLLSCFFLLFPVTSLYSQHYRGMIPDSYQQLQAYDRAGITSDEQHAIQDLQTRCQKFEHAFQDMQLTIQDQHTLVLEVLDNSDKVKRLESSLDLMEAKLRTAEDEIQELKEEIKASRKAAVSKPKAPVNKPKPAVQIDPATGERIDAPKNR